MPYSKNTGNRVIMSDWGKWGIGVSCRIVQSKGGNTMSIEVPYFWKYLVVNEDGIAVGISDDAPEKGKKEYEEFKKYEKEMESKGIKI